MKVARVLCGPDGARFFSLRASTTCFQTASRAAISNSSSNSSPIDVLPFRRLWHLKVMQPEINDLYRLRIPSGPEPFPVQEPPDPPENPDVPVREPDPEDPGQI
jgi:hypothetical protein